MTDEHMRCPVVLIESPYFGVEGSERYVACCLLDSLIRGEAPVASHVLYPLALPEHVESFTGQTGRDIGLQRRDALARAADYCVRYTDIGTSAQMNRYGVYAPDRALTGEAKRIWEAGEWPSKARLTKNH